MATFQDGYQSVLNNFGGIQGTFESAEYAAKVRDTVKEAVNNLDATAKQRTNVSQDQLKGWLAEPWHADTFSINAIASGRPNVQAQVPNDNGPADLYVKVEEILLKKAQAKYYKNAEATAKAISKGKYDGMTKIVPSDQLEKVKAVAWQEYLRNKNSRPNVAKHYKDTFDNATDSQKYKHIESQPLSEPDAKDLAKDFKKNGEIDPEQYGLNTESFVKWHDIGRESLEAGAHAAIISAAVKITPYIVEIFKESHKTGKLDFQDLIDNKEDIIRGTGHAALRGAVAAGVTASLKTGLLGESAKSMSPAAIGIATTMAINAISYAVDLHQGKITKEQFALYCIRDTTILSFAITGAYIGQSAIPIPVLGAMIGNLIGSTLGAVVHDSAYQGALEICVESGWTMFGLIEQNYSIPENHLKGINLKTVKVNKPNIDIATVDEIQAYTINVNTLSFTLLRRGVIGYNMIGYQ